MNREEDFNPYHTNYSWRYSPYDHYRSISTNAQFQSTQTKNLYNYLI